MFPGRRPLSDDKQRREATRRNMSTVQTASSCSTGQRAPDWVQDKAFDVRELSRTRNGKASGRGRCHEAPPERNELQIHFEDVLLVDEHARALTRRDWHRSWNQVNETQRRVCRRLEYGGQTHDSFVRSRPAEQPVPWSSSL